MDIRRRMLFKKKASSSGGGGSTTGGSYTVNLNSQWKATTAVPNPDSTLYDGVYRSVSNYNVHSGVATMYITIKDCSSFKMYIRSYAESNYDYVMVSQLDKTINGNTTYSDTALVKAHTRGNQQSGTALSSYTLVEFTGISSGEHTITVVYRKDSSANSGDDRGYVLINKVNEGHGTVEPEEPESGGSSSRINVGDIAYWDGSKVKTISSDKWTTSIGTPVGVVVVPEGFAPDGKARIVSLKPADSNGNQSDSHVILKWGIYGTDTSLTNYNMVPITKNVDSNSNGKMDFGYLPSDKFTGVQSFVDTDAKYSDLSYVNEYYIPSPYLEDEPNPEYYKTISGYNNALSDFNGFNNTQTLVGLGLNYEAANACWNYNDGSSNLQWYLPAMGELGYILPRFNLINASITAVGGVAVSDVVVNDMDIAFWSSSEHSKETAFYLPLHDGCASYLYKDNRGNYYRFYARPFCTIENNNKINTDNYLTIEARENGLTASLSVNDCEYCVDGDGNWKSLAAGASTESINIGHTLSFRGKLTPIIAGTNQGIGIFTISKKCNLKGNCMSMLFGDNAVNNYSLSDKLSAFFKLFYKCSNIVTVSSGFLPATTLSNNCYSNMFHGCSSLTTAPELPATTLASCCYSTMFQGCTSLTTAPELPAITLAFDCYSYMFRDCTNLTTAPELPATTLANYCYSRMFYGCTNLTTAPELPATTLASCCYQSMFHGCTKLTTAPELPATTLAESCYDSMFRNCTSLITAPELPATTLANYCYYYMFSYCTSLTTAPELPATKLANWCYQSMFYNCTKLKYIKMLATNISASNCLYYWTYGVASTGTFVKNPAMNSLPTGVNGIPSGWTVVNNGEPVIDINNYLTIEACEDGLTASLSTNACEYCVDGDGNWKTLAADTATQSINIGHTLSFRGNLTPNGSNGIGTFSISKKCNLKGNCMSMLFGDNAADNYSLSGKDYAFYKLFYNCSNIVNVSSNFLPATKLTTWCYYYMFYGCTNLTAAPELSATTLAKGCYGYMFYGCTNLTTAPELPATTLADYCYYYMFSGCTRLTTAPELPATKLTTRCYQYMFQDCYSLTTAPELPATTLALECYYYMFSGCTRLTTAPELPATKLAIGCYRYMFYNCHKLNYIKMLATDISASSCLYDWVYNVASTGTFVKNPAMTRLPSGSSGIPSGWTVVNDGEESGGNLITFTIDGVEYQAEEGMTWGEWVDSEYNVINASTYNPSSGMGYYIAVPTGQPGNAQVICNSSYYPVTITNEIISNYNYNVNTEGGGH